ncbi:MAG: sulfatase [Candidatus Binatia bacterium]
MIDKPLNVLLVVLDGARPDHLACYGYERETAPFLDKMARDGVRFARAFGCGPAAVSSHAAMLTGLFAAAHGATEEHRALRPSVPLLSEHLKRAGYRTAAFCPHPDIAPETGFGRGFDRFHTQRSGGYIAGTAADYARRASDRVLGRRDAGARRTTEAVCDWLGLDDAPFFAFVHFAEPAHAQPPPAPYDRLFLPRAPAQPSAHEVASALHAGALRYIDLRLTQIADRLIANGQWEQTLVIATAGHAAALTDDAGDPLSDARLHVPLLMRGPGLPRGFVVDEFAQPPDLFATIAAVTGSGEVPAPLQGRILLRQGAAVPGRRCVIAETYRNEPGDVRRKALRTSREKFVWQSDEANALFDLNSDPHERRNLFAADTGRADGLRRQLFDWLATAERWAPPEAELGSALEPQRAHT